jgi:hypothetical protein
MAIVRAHAPDEPLGVPGPLNIPARDAITLYQPPEGFKDGDPRHKASGHRRDVRRQEVPVEARAG